MELLGTSIRVAAYVLEPFVNPCLLQPSCHHPGVEAALMNESLRYLGFNVTFDLHPSLQVALGEVENGSADVLSVLQPAQQGYDPDGPLRATPTLLSEKPVFFVRPASDSLGSNIFSASDYRLWVAFAITFMVFCVLEQLLKWLLHPYTQRRLMMFGRTSWFLALGVMLGVYANFLAITLSLEPAPLQPFHSLPELGEALARKQFRLAIVGNSFDPEGAFQAAFNPQPPFASPASERLAQVTELFNLLRCNQAYASNPPLLVKSVEALGRAVQAGYGNTELVGVVFLSQARLFGSQFCRLQMIDLVDMGADQFAYLYHIDSVVGPLLQLYLNRGAGTDLYQRRMDAYIHQERLRGALDCASAGPRPIEPIKLGQVQAVFYVLFVCTLAALMTLLWERAWEFWSCAFVSPKRLFLGLVDWLRRAGRRVGPAALHPDDPWQLRNIKPDR